MSYRHLVLLTGFLPRTFLASIFQAFHQVLKFLW
jgi:hypothetical protein